MQYFQSKFIQSGAFSLSHYSGDIPKAGYVHYATLLDMMPSAQGIPVTIEHDGPVVGQVCHVFENIENHWFYVIFMVNDRGISSIFQQHTPYVSCSYKGLWGSGDIKNGLYFDKILKSGVFTELALVKVPRYEEALIKPLNIPYVNQQANQIEHDVLQCNANNFIFKSEQKNKQDNISDTQTNKKLTSMDIDTNTKDSQHVCVMNTALNHKHVQNIKIGNKQKKQTTKDISDEFSDSTIGDSETQETSSVNHLSVDKDKEQNKEFLHIMNARQQFSTQLTSKRGKSIKQNYHNASYRIISTPSKVKF